ncbi:MAG: cysteine desulfurase [Tetrasphaera sp.]|nr:cysteine desulfurase [Tetrasphaera sp.]
MRAYLDHAATTPMRRVAVETLAELAARTGNASSLHASGRRARAVVEDARERVAAALGAHPSEVVFTSGGTESDNLAVKGAYAARRASQPARRLVVTSAVEHHAVLDAVEHLVATQEAQAHWLRVDATGVVDAQELLEVLARRENEVALVSVQWANNEIGTVQPIAALAAAARDAGVPMHTDAVQAAGVLPVDVAAAGVDLLTVSSHKVGGPLGVGALLVGRRTALEPGLHGGGQQRGLRSGTLDAPGIAAFAAALDEAIAERQQAAARLAALRDRLISGALALGLGIEVTGRWEAGDTAYRLPGNAHLRVPDCDGDALLYLLDAAGVECSTGSACAAGTQRPSHVLLALGVAEDQARGALRFSLGHTSSEDDVDAVLAVLPQVVQQARRAAGVSR